MTDIYNKVWQDIPAPLTKRTGLSAMLGKLEEVGQSIILPPIINKGSIHPTARSLGFKVKYREEYDPEKKVKVWLEKQGHFAYSPELMGFRVWRMT